MAAKPKMPRHLYTRGPAQVFWFIRRFGLREVFLKPARIALGPLLMPLAHEQTFQFQGASFRTFHHRHNATWANERSVEIPIVWRAVERCHGSVLEVGNVLSHYFPVTWDVVDRYERAEGVLNIDVIDFEPQVRYDLILSISTLEHVGFDEEVQDPSGLRILAAIEHLRSRCLADSGQFLFTLPLGYNPAVDRLIREDRLPTERAGYLQRTERRQWGEVSKGDALRSRFGRPFPYANAIMVGTCRSPSLELAIPPASEPPGPTV